MRVLAKTRRRAVRLDGDREVAYDDVARVWLHATVERAVDREDDGLLLVVCLEPFDDHDGAPVGALSKRFAVVWPSNHVVCAGPPLPDAPARHRLCANQPVSWDVGAKLQNSLARSHRSRFG